MLGVVEVNGLRGADLFAGATHPTLQAQTVVGVDDVLEWYGLVEHEVRGRPHVQAEIEVIGHDLGTDLRALVAGHALLHIDIFRSLPDRDGQVADLAGDVHNLRAGEQFNVQAPTTLDELGG